MIYPIKFRKINSGFSLIEVLLVLAIFGILFSISASVYSSFQAENNLKIATSNIVQALRYTQRNSEAVAGDASWGVKISVSQADIYEGNTLFENISLPGGITLGGLSEVFFDKVTGKTNDTGTITVNNSFGSKNITINTYGTIDY